jgi:hypothetical protein
VESSKYRNSPNCGELLPYIESVAKTVTFNTNEFNRRFWLAIPKDDAKDLTLEQVTELGLIPKDISIEDYIEREAQGDSLKPWLIINPEGLDKSAGFHMIQFTFMNNKLNVYQSFYFSYISQVDNPDKPYIYMNRGEQT